MIAYLERNSGSEDLVELFHQAIESDRDVYLLAVNWGEIIYHILRHGGPSIVAMAENSLNMLPVQIVDATKDLCTEAANLKIRYGIAYNDCLAIALAIRKKGELVTGNPQVGALESALRIRRIGAR